MTTKLLCFTLIIFWIIPEVSVGQACNNWAEINKEISGVEIGDLDISGNQLTIEALINRTTIYNTLYDGGDVVSKHDNPGDANYLLRPTVAQITTSDGFFETKRACPIEINKTYHIAMVYDGKTLKFYRNGFLMDEVAASGNLYQNDWLTKIGTTANEASPYPADFIGFINEVRIWNVARSQNDIKKYIQQSLPNPASQPGLVAYYTFNDLKNKQGNIKWDGKIIGDAAINQTNPECTSFIADSCGGEQCNVLANFTYTQLSCNPTSIHFQSTASNADDISWDFGNGITAENVADTVINYPSFGNYLVKLFAKTNAGCVDTFEQTINVNIIKRAVIINHDTAICAGNTVSLNAVDGIDYCWSPAIGLSNTSIKNPLAAPAVSTKYYLHILTDSSKPVLLDSVFINVLPLPVIKVSNDTIVCGNASVQLNANGASSYTWSPSRGLSNTVIDNPVANVASTITYVVTGKGNNACSVQDSVKITVNPRPEFTVNPSDTAICMGDSIVLTASGGDIFKWQPGESISNTAISAPKAFPTSHTTYQVLVTNSICKVSDTLNTAITVHKAPDLILTKSNNVDCLAPQATLTASGATQYTWSPATFISDVHTTNPVVSPPSDTWYFVNAQDENMCKRKDSILVKSTFVAGSLPFQVPGAFTPNHDGLNDCFSLKNWGPVDEFEISIYDRRGYLVFHADDINSCWNGSVNGLPQSAGTFVYQIRVASKCTEGVVFKKGTIVLIR